MIGGGFIVLAAGCLASPAAAPLLVGGGWVAAMGILGHRYRVNRPAPDAMLATHATGATEPIETIDSAGTFDSPED